MTATRYATGANSWFICDRCGLRGNYLAARKERQTSAIVCEDCKDDPYPFWALRARRPDPENLRHPRPDVPLTPTEEV